MGKISSYKKLYDELAYKFFNEHNWSVMVNKSGKQLCDLVAINLADPRIIAIIEVKSPKETSASVKWDDTKNISELVDKKYVKYLQTARSTIARLFPSRKEALAKFYAIVIMCQLFRYFIEAKVTLKGHPKLMFGDEMDAYRFIPYLVVPAEKALQLNTALGVLLQHNYITDYYVMKDKNVCITGLTYNLEKLSGS